MPKPRNALGRLLSPDGRPRQSHWGWMIAGGRYLWASPVTLPSIALGLLLGGRCRWVEGVAELHGPGIAAVLRRLPVQAAAITLGHAVLGQSEQALRRTRVHERVHVRQYACFGPLMIPLYLTCSAWLLLRGRDAYRENPFEVQAFAAAERAARADGNAG